MPAPQDALDSHGGVRTYLFTGQPQHTDPGGSHHALARTRDGSRPHQADGR